jgi:Putative 2OG-Fe(II) oxygenase
MLGQKADRPAAIRLKRAALLIKMMRLDEAQTELSEPFPLPQDRAARLLQADLLMLRDDPACAAQAATLLAALAMATPDADERRALNVKQADALAICGDYRRARAIAWQAACGTVPDIHAISLLLRLGLAGGEAETLCASIDAATSLPARGLALLCALRARSGQVAQAREAAGFDRFFSRTMLFSPSPETHAMHAAIADEIRADPDLHYSAGRRPGQHLWRIEGLPTRGMTAIPALLEAIAQAVRAYVAALPDSNGHPFLRKRPANAKLTARAAIAAPDGFEDWHTHDKAWVSGIYYVAMPPEIEGARSGSIAFGWPGGDSIESAAEGIILANVHPAAGELLLFPSYQHHRTFPLHRPGERIAIAFDVMAL